MCRLQPWTLWDACGNCAQWRQICSLTSFTCGLFLGGNFGCKKNAFELEGKVRSEYCPSRFFVPWGLHKPYV
ncbi:hypothetical protein Y032_0012g1668 [Ancylostoma ceylanicum]|uniref:Uncharacterized protein n=1 Tax=Ancylostoma ceylanicum TaxID=53326 RepID=A0A016VBP2_9BILA|nr:hypothetical protein Y032_0012g1668 [Ancylostoma ceylanicum]